MTKVVKYYLDVRPIVSSNNQIEVGISLKLLKLFFFSPLQTILVILSNICYRVITKFQERQILLFVSDRSWVSVMTQWIFRSVFSRHLRTMLAPITSNISYLLLLFFNIIFLQNKKKENNG